MNDLKIMYKKLKKDAIVPTYAHVGDAGCDLYSIEKVTLDPGDIKVVGTGISIQLPAPYVAGQIRSRSGLAMKQGITIVTGTVDPNYRGELKVGLINLGKEKVTLPKSSRIAQLVFCHIYVGHFIESTELTESYRGSDGLGSTGV